MAYQTVGSVKKALAVLEHLAAHSIDSEPLTLSEIARAAGIPAVTARNLLRTLEECGYAQRTGHGRYREGQMCGRLFRAEGVLGRLRELAAPILRACVADLGESLLLASIIRGRRVELLRCQAPDDTAENQQWYANAEFYRMRTTRVIMAWFSPAQLAAFLETNGLPSPEDWPECENSPEKLKTELRKIRKSGGCCDQTGDLIAIAVPILTPANEAVASLGCYARVSRTDKPRAAGILHMLHECAKTIQNELNR